MKICEIFTSIQGESSYAGKPCHFIRLSGCNLQCSYCDTTYSHSEGVDIKLEMLKKEITGFVRYNLFMITGGEPLLQEDTYQLTDWLLKKGFTVLIETNGSLPINKLNNKCIVIMDVKTPGSKMADFNNLSNLALLKPKDEVKFVLTNEEDYIWAKDFIRGYKIKKGIQILFSPAFKMLNPKELAEWIIRDGLDVRLNIQLHKIIFGDGVRGV